jgi:CRP-like cAMP-binding protein
MPRDLFEPLLRRLRLTADISEQDEQAICSLPLRLKEMPAGQVVTRTGDKPSVCCLVVDGFVQRSKVVAESHRQILSFHQPGDIPDLQSLFLPVLDHEIITLGECKLGFISHGPLRELIRNSPKIAEVLWRDTLIDAAIFREWICNVGQRSAVSRFAHLVLEIYTRLATIGRVDGLSFEFPATQVIFAEAIGTSLVHMNRVVQELRKEGLLDFERGWITIHDMERFRSLADFDPLYLHLSPLT